MAIMFLSLFAVSCYCAAEAKQYSCKLDGDKVIITEGTIADADAWASWDETEQYSSYSETGWGKIHIWSNPASSSYNQMYCAGYVDTYASFTRVQESYRLFREIQLCEEAKGVCSENMKPDWPKEWQEFINGSIEYTRQQAETDDPYWRRIKLILAQIDGMLAGYNARAKPEDRLREIDFWMLQSGGDLDDIGVKWPAAGLEKDPEFRLHCTGLVKIAPRFSDIWFAQDTWSDCRELHAYLKEYNLNVPEFKANRVMISTRTGHMSSVDDFWVNDQGLVVMETTMHCFNDTLYDLLKPQTILTWIRAYHAMFSSANGSEWCENFIRENSGTYNNEYLILDTKLFQPNQIPPANLLWMIEQYPGNYVMADITEDLVRETYFISVNTPRFQYMWDISNYTGAQQIDSRKAPFWSVEGQPRTKIIHREALKLKNYSDFQWLMRYNNYTKDELQIIPATGEQEPAMGVLARYDLRPENGTAWGAKNHFAGLDAKTFSVMQYRNSSSFDAINSPKYDEGIPAFDFKDWPKISHYGLPEVVKFPWTNFSYADYCPLVGDGDKEKCYEVGCGFCMYNQKCWSGDKQGPSKLFGYECENGWGVKTVTPSWAIPVIVAVSVTVLVLLVAILAGHLYYRRTHPYEAL